MTDVSREDLEQKFTQLKGEIENAAGATRATATKVGIAAGIVLLILAFILGSRRGKAGKTIVEVRRL
ncbi:MAG: hypothetical protein AAF567_07855 [Actinomycetota bacterium]